MLLRVAVIVAVAGGLHIEGSRTEGGVPSSFEKTLDLNTGYSRMTQRSGEAVFVQGYDGKTWNSFNGIVNTVDLPALVADARARAFVERAGWLPRGMSKDRPPDGSDVEIVYDQKSGLPKQVTIETDNGPVVTTYDDFRPVGQWLYPFRQTEVDNVGSTVTLQIERVEMLASLPADALARPSASRHGSLIDGRPATVDFELTGTHRSHIMVPAKVSGQEATLIFDTGAANYLIPDAVKKLGLTVSGGINLGGVGSSSTTGGYARLDRIALGSAELRDEIAIAGPSPFPSGASLDGLTGYEFLSEFRTTLDYNAKTLVFEDFDTPWSSRGRKLPYYSDGHSIYVEASVGSVRGLFRLDTGDGGTVTIFPEFARRHSLGAVSAPAKEKGGGLGGATVVRESTLPDFTLAGYTFHDLPVDFSQNTTGGFAARSLAGNLGAGVLSRFKITFDYRARWVSFEPQEPGGHAGADR